LVEPEPACEEHRPNGEYQTDTGPPGAVKSERPSLVEEVPGGRLRLQSKSAANAVILRTMQK